MTIASFISMTERGNRDLIINDKCNESSDSGVVNCSLPAESTSFVFEGSVSKETDRESAKTENSARYWMYAEFDFDKCIAYRGYSHW